MSTTTDLSAALDHDLDAVLALCADLAELAEADGQPLTPAAVIESFEDAHDMALSDGEKLWLADHLRDDVPDVPAPAETAGAWPCDDAGPWEFGGSSQTRV